MGAGNHEGDDKDGQMVKNGHLHQSGYRVEELDIPML